MDQFNSTGKHPRQKQVGSEKREARPQWRKILLSRSDLRFCFRDLLSLIRCRVCFRQSFLQLRSPSRSRSCFSFFAFMPLLSLVHLRSYFRFCDRFRLPLRFHSFPLPSHSPSLLLLLFHVPFRLRFCFCFSTFPFTLLSLSRPRL